MTHTQTHTHKHTQTHTQIHSSHSIPRQTRTLTDGQDTLVRHSVACMRNTHTHTHIHTHARALWHRDEFHWAYDVHKGPCVLYFVSDMSQVRDRVGSAVKNGKATQLRNQCQAALGFHFAEVYAYLRRARTQDTPPGEYYTVCVCVRVCVSVRYSLAPFLFGIAKGLENCWVCALCGSVYVCVSAEEAVVQKTLSDLVGGDRTLLQGCFMVDQLVFTEMMYS